MICWLLLLLASPAEPRGIEVRFPSTDERLSITVADASTAWAKFLDQLFAHFDRNNDKVLSPMEAARLFPLPHAENSSVQADFRVMDANTDGKITPEEFHHFYEQAGYTPVIGVTRATTREQLALSSALFRHLDRDGDGIISTSEWMLTPGLMRRLDENEDDALVPIEIVGTNSERLPSAFPRLTATIARPTAPAHLRLQLAEKASVKLEKTAPGFLAENATTFRVPGGRLRVTILPDNQDHGFRTARDFYLALFSEAAGKKPGLTLEEIETDSSVTAIAAMFPFADRDGDGKLTMTELKTFLELIELGMRSQVQLIIEDRGANLFEALDFNSDGKLDAHELRQANRFNPLKRADIPSTFQLVVSRQTVAKNFGPVPVPVARTDGKPKTSRERVGPAWFQVQDTNQDGYVSRAEFRGSPAAFTKLDTNSDERISVQEAEAASK